jgi:hypothetical protein
MYKMIVGNVKAQADVQVVGAAVQRIDFTPAFAEPPVVTVTPMIDQEQSGATPVRFALVSVAADHCVVLLEKGYIRWIHWHAIGRTLDNED